MLDLTIETYWCCQSCQEWSTTIESNKIPNKFYTVRFDAISHHNRDLVEYDYSCDCEAYKFRRGNWCKHIKMVKSQKCSWNQLTHGNSPILKDGKYLCPICGNIATQISYNI